LVHTHSPPSVASVIEIPTYASPNIYTVMVFKDGSISEYTEDLLSLAPEQTSQEISFLPAWVQGGANATLFLSHMSKPRHGTLQLSSGEWYFFPGKS
jgi:hypothetical protein